MTEVLFPSDIALDADWHLCDVASAFVKEHGEVCECSLAAALRSAAAVYAACEQPLEGHDCSAWTQEQGDKLCEAEHDLLDATIGYFNEHESEILRHASKRCSTARAFLEAFYIARHLFRVEDRAETDRKFGEITEGLDRESPSTEQGPG